jgi:hypothetical protein
MNSKKQISLVAVAIASFLSILAPISGVTTSEVMGQQQNATNTTSTSSNLTQVAGTMANLTQSDFDELIDNLNSARGAIRDNDTAAVTGELGSAETEVRTFMTEAGGENSTGGQQLSTVLDHINTAQDASGSNDTLKAFQAINTADTELLKITQKLPASEDEDD